MARATDYEQQARNILENAVATGERTFYNPSVDKIDIGPELDRLCARLHDHDGWADWREIYASVYGAALAACARRRKPVWSSARLAIADWGEEHSVDTKYARV
jgi:hypothetical protein